MSQEELGTVIPTNKVHLASERLKEARTPHLEETGELKQILEELRIAKVPSNITNGEVKVVDYNEIATTQEAYLEKNGIIYSKEYQNLENLDRRYKVAIDLDGVLTGEGEDINTIALRPGVLEFFETLHINRDKIKLSLWTSSPRERTEAILSRLGIKNHFDTVITRENYDLKTGLNEDQRSDNRQKFPAEYEYQSRYATAKPLKSIGYSLLIDDTHGLEASQVNGFQLIRVPQFGKYTRPTPLPPELADTIITAAQQK